MIVCDICGKKIENDDTGNYIALGEDIFYADVCSNCLTSIHNLLKIKEVRKSEIVYSKRNCQSLP